MRTKVQLQITLPRPADNRAALDAIPGASVLVVDDCSTSLAVAERQLEELGLSVRTADSGPAALAAMDGERFDAILMDLRMPGMDGFATALLIREKEASRKPAAQAVPIIALTSAASGRDIAASLAAGMNDHVAKPFDPLRLAGKLAKWITAKRAAA